MPTAAALPGRHRAAHADAGLHRPVLERRHEVARLARDRRCGPAGGYGATICAHSVRRRRHDALAVRARRAGCRARRRARRARARRAGPRRPPRRSPRCVRNAARMPRFARTRGAARRSRAAGVHTNTRSHGPSGRSSMRRDGVDAEHRRRLRGSSRRPRPGSPPARMLCSATKPNFPGWRRRAGDDHAARLEQRARSRRRP